MEDTNKFLPMLNYIVKKRNVPDLHSFTVRGMGKFAFIEAKYDKSIDIKVVDCNDEGKTQWYRNLSVPDAARTLEELELDADTIEM